MGAANIDLVRRLAGADQGLAVVATSRADGTIQASVVNAGVMADPDGSGDVIALVARGGGAKLRNLAERPRATVVFRAGWEWVSVEGATRIVGPDDIDAESLRVLLREVFIAAGGTHDDWDEYDRVMREDGRVAVFVKPDRMTSN